MKKLILMILTICTMLSAFKFESKSAELCYLNDEYIDICFDMQEKYDVSACLLIAIIQRESSGKNRAVNSSGAYDCVGLMQVSMIHGYTKEQLFDPRTNIDAGTQILLSYVEKYEGDLYMALAKYHGEKKPNPLEPSSYVTGIVETAFEIEKLFYGGN